MIIASVRYDEQCFLCVVCAFHFAEAQINSIQQSRLPVRGRKHQPVLQIFDAGCERAGQLRAIVEINQEKLVFRIRGMEKLNRRLPGSFNLVAHAPAHIENHADRDGHILARKAQNFLLHSVFEYAEVALFQPGHKPPIRIRHGNVDQR